MAIDWFPDQKNGDANKCPWPFKPINLRTGEGAALGDARGGQQAGAGEIFVDGAGGAAALVDGPDDEGLATPTIAAAATFKSRESGPAIVSLIAVSAEDASNCMLPPKKNFGSK